MHTARTLGQSHARLSVPPALLATLLVTTATLWLLAACGSGGGSADPGAGGGDHDLGAFALAELLDPPVGAILPQLDDEWRSEAIIADDHAHGQARHIGLRGLAWGRLVDVYDVAGRRVHPDFVVSPTLEADGVDFVFETDLVSAVTRLTIQHAADSDSFRSAFSDSGPLPRLDSDLVPIDDLGLPGHGHFSLVARDAALVLAFDDLLDEATIRAQALAIMQHEDLSGALSEGLAHGVRVIADPNHGGFVMEGEELSFHTTRAIIDLQVSEAERDADTGGLLSGLSPLGLTAGLPGVSTVSLRASTGATALANLAGNLLAPSGTTGLGGALVRSMQTGSGPGSFLGDTQAPRIVGTQPADILAAPGVLPGGGPLDFLIPQLEFGSATCGSNPQRGDVIRQPGIVAVVSRNGTGLVNGVATNVPVRLVVGDAQTWPSTAAGSCLYLSAYDLGDEPECFVSVSPTATGWPDAPTDGVSPDAILSVGFSEPMDEGSFVLYENILLSTVFPPSVGTEYVAGDRIVSAALTRVALVPSVALEHLAGASDDYFLSLRGGSRGPTDLAGNPLAGALTGAPIVIDASEQPVSSGSRVLRFTSQDDEPPFGSPGTGPLTELNGQVVFDAATGSVRARPVVRFEALADRSQALPAAMTAFASGTQVPLVPFGAKLQTIWRDVDVGMDVFDSSGMNVDVEGLSWSPAGGGVIADHYSEFEIALAHGARLPDEVLDPASLFPSFANSGLRASYALNVEGTQDVVHPRQSGYTINPADQYVSASGTVMMPFPLNAGAAPGDEEVFTWRDTALGGRAAPLGGGAPVDQFYVVNGQSVPAKRYPANEVPSVGLPLLMEFRTFPDTGALGLNSFDVSLATNSSARPYFRAFSAGGIDQSQNVVFVDPDLETEANGGFIQSWSPPGAQSFGRVATFMFGSMVLVVRVSRSVTTWFAASVSGGVASNPAFTPATIVPAWHEQPAGTSVEIAYRGATSVTTQAALDDARTLDIYGDWYASPVGHTASSANPGIAFLGSVAWSDQVDDINGASYYQLRVTLNADLATGNTPSLSALGLAWRD